MTTQNFGQIKSNNADIEYDDVAQTWTFSEIVTAKATVTELAGVMTMVAHVHQAAGSGGTLDHGAALTGLTDDDHTQYAKLAGRSGGQTQYGGTGSADDLRLDSTSHETPGLVYFGGGSDAYYQEARSSLIVPNVSTAGVVNVKAYGAVGNGTTDDAAAFQSALTAIAGTSASLCIPDGDYKIASSLVIPATTLALIIEGRNFGAHLIHATTDPLFTHASASPAHVTFRDVYITQFSATAGDIVVFDGGVSNIVFDRVSCTLSNPASSVAVLTGSVAYCAFDRVFATQAAGATAPLIDIASTSPANFFGITIENSGFWGTVTGAAPLLLFDSKGGMESFGPTIRNTYFEIPQAGAVHCYSTAFGHFDHVWAGDVTGVTAPLFLFTESAGSAVESQGHVFTSCYILGGSVATPDIRQTGSAGGLTIISSRTPIIEAVAAPKIINPYGSLTFVGATPEAYWNTAGLLKTPSVLATQSRVGRWAEWTGRFGVVFGAAKTTGYVNLGAGAMEGLIEISITDTYSAANTSGVLTKQFAVIRSANGAALQSTRISEVVGNVCNVFNIGDLDLDGTNLRIPINWISGADNCTVHVRALFATESYLTTMFAALSLTDPTGSAAAAAVQYVSWPYMQDVSAVSGAVWKCPADATDPTGGGGAAAGRIPIKIGADTKYIPYY